MRRSLCMLLAVGVLTGMAVGADDKKDGKGTVVGLDGLSSRTPADWKEETATSKMRAHQFRIPRAKDDKEDAELVIFYFGPGGGGGVEDNIKRWKGFFTPPAGKSIDDVSKVDKFKVGAVPVTSLDVHGTYLMKTRPFDPSDKGEKRPDYRMLGAVFESPKGPYFIRLVGPAKTVEQHKKGFDNWLKGFK
jgi:hypothetical protein